MKVLLLGEFSGLHHNLAYGLREYGVDVSVASNGDFWKGYPRDIDLKQPERFKQVRFLSMLLQNFHKLCGYDVVLLINSGFLGSSPFFTQLVFKILKKYNGRVFLGANGMDYFYNKYALDGNLKYSVFQVPSIKEDPYIKHLISYTKKKTIINLNKETALSASGVIASAPGYYKAYNNFFPDKTVFIPLSINTKEFKYVNTINDSDNSVRFFLGHQNGREKRKGSDIIEKVLRKLKRKYPKEVEIEIVRSIPFNKYQYLLNRSHVLCDQLYAYATGLNGIIGLSKGLILAGCAENDFYEMLKENVNKPIVNINTNELEMFERFELLIEKKEDLKELSFKSREFAVKHFDSVKVAKQYLDYWNKFI